MKTHRYPTPAGRRSSRARPLSGALQEGPRAMAIATWEDEGGSVAPLARVAITGQELAEGSRDSAATLTAGHKSGPRS